MYPAQAACIFNSHLIAHFIWTCKALAQQLCKMAVHPFVTVSVPVSLGEELEWGEFLLELQSMLELISGSGAIGLGLMLS